ncbi:hypothetical protein LTR95_002534 [Oleoguttula sp. CCFEE 5521]
MPKGTPLKLGLGYWTQTGRLDWNNIKNTAKDSKILYTLATQTTPSLESFPDLCDTTHCDHMTYHSLAMASLHPFQSSRLLYRAVETPQDGDFFLAIQQDPFGYANSNFTISRPQNAKDASEYQKYVADDTMLGVVFCLLDDPSKSIGVLHFGALKPNHAQHCHSMVAIDVLPEWQGKGYGTEALEWGLRWAFDVRGLHRVNIGVFGYNTGAKRLYERLGFVVEGCRREYLWFRGKWYDDYSLGMLRTEWEERYGERELAARPKPEESK